MVLFIPDRTNHNSLGVAELETVGGRYMINYSNNECKDVYKATLD